MTTPRLCNAVVERLRATMPGYKVDHFPDTPRDLLRFAGKSEALFVSYEGSVDGELLSIDPLSADRTVELAVNIVVRSLVGPKGASETIEAVRGNLFGWQPTVTVPPVPPAEEATIESLGFMRLVPVRDGFVAEDNGTWRFVVVFRTTTVSVANAVDPNLAGPPFTTPVFQEPS